MSGSLRFKTVQSGRVILYSLYDELSDQPYFTCDIVVPVSTLDSVENATLTLYVLRKQNSSHDYQLANGDRIHHTKARFEPEGEPFAIDVITRSREIDVTNATISMSNEVDRIIKNML